MEIKKAAVEGRQLLLFFVGNYTIAQVIMAIL